MRDTHGTYAAMFNRKYGFTGHLWQARFYSCVLDDEHLAHCARYVERNPVRAGMVARSRKLSVVQRGPHLPGQHDRYLDEGLPLIGVIQDWPAWLAGNESEEAIQKIREATATGRACGSEDFIPRLESQSGRSLRPLKRGRRPRPDAAQDRDSPFPAGW